MKHVYKNHLGSSIDTLEQFCEYLNMVESNYIDALKLEKIMQETTKNRNGEKNKLERNR